MNRKYQESQLKALVSFIAFLLFLNFYTQGTVLVIFLIYGSLFFWVKFLKEAMDEQFKIGGGFSAEEEHF